MANQPGVPAEALHRHDQIEAGDRLWKHVAVVRTWTDHRARLEPTGKRGKQALWLNRLGQEIVHAGGEATLTFLVQRVGGDGDHRQFGEAALLPDEGGGR